MKLKLQYFGQLMLRAHSLEKTLMPGKIEGRRKRRQQRMRWLDGITFKAETKEELKSFLVKVKEVSEKVGLKLNV